MLRYPFIWPPFAASCFNLGSFCCKEEEDEEEEDEEESLAAAVRARFGAIAREPRVIIIERFACMMST